MKTFVILFSTLIITLSISAQDLIIFRDMEVGEVQAKVKTVKANHITYTPYDQQNSKAIKVLKSKIELIIYEDGMKQYFAVEDFQPDTLVFSSPGSNLQNLSDRDVYAKGQADAKTYYKGNGPLWGTLLPTAIPGYGVIAGAISGGIIAAVPPKVDPYALPNPDLYIQNHEYAAGYERQVMRKKLGRVLTGYGIGIGIQTLIIIIIVNSY